MDTNGGRIEVSAGHCTVVPEPDGEVIGLPRSISYKALDDAEFHEMHESVKAFVRTPHAYR